MLDFEVVPPDPPNEGLLFVDHSKAGRGGHLGHALVEYEPGKILAFYPNCSGDRKGHNGDGWMEFKRSEDGGKTWSGAAALEYSKHTYCQGKGRSVFCEKAVMTAGREIVLFNLECDISENTSWIPHGIPTVLRSSDGGRSWSDPEKIGDKRGRIFDVITLDGCILALEFCNDGTVNWTGNRPEHVYALYASTDQGRTFSTRSILPFNTMERGYGAMEILHDGALIVYIYNEEDEHNLEYSVSYDAGRTWDGVRKAFFEKKIRNPQIAAFKGGYVLHGRSGNSGEGSGHFVLYSSRDGINWDSGQYLRLWEAGAGAYSNNLLVGNPDPQVPERMLVQASHAYEESRTNILHWWLV